MNALTFCGRAIGSRSKYSDKGLHTCARARGHDGRCEEFPYLEHLQKIAPRVRQKIIRDSTMTTGAAWKSEDAGPNRIRRWAMLLSDGELLKLGIDMRKLQPQVVAKLREKAAPYEACMAVSRKLTALAYCMRNAPDPPSEINEYLAQTVGRLERGSTNCLVCVGPLDFAQFSEARRGKAEIETSHANPRLHNPENVGFAHRVCNIAQGSRTLDEFYAWMREVLARVDRRGR